MEKRWLVALIVGFAGVFVIAGLWVYITNIGSWDYYPPQGVLRAERTADNMITFAIEDEVFGAAGKSVKFDDCAIDLRINGTHIGPNDYTIGLNWGVRTTHGCSIFNATVLTDGSVRYIIVLNDVDRDGNVSEGDTISLVATEPLRPATTYAILFLTELRSSWSFGEFQGNYTA